MNVGGRYLVLALALSLSAAALGETVYLTDQFQAGLHEDKSPDSPILKNISSGTTLELIKRDKNFAYVRDPQGVSGWIDNSYLVKDAPAASGGDSLRAERDGLEKKLEEANLQITRLQSTITTSGGKDQTDLQQQLNSERIKTGELQIELAELKKRLGQSNDTESLYQQIEAMKEKNMALQIKLDGIQNQADAEHPGDRLDGGATGLLKQDWKRAVLYFFIYILIGVVLGMFVMDFYNRRRHGGFRV